MSNNLDASNFKYGKLIKWIGHNRINYYYKTCTLIYTIVMLLWDNVEDTNKIQYIILNMIITIVDQYITYIILGLGLELLILHRSHLANKSKNKLCLNVPQKKLAL